MLSFNRSFGKFSSQLSRSPHVLKRLKHWQTVKKCYQTLGVKENCEDDALKLAFVTLAKRYHPDSGTAEADAVKFSEIETAYREICKVRTEQKKQEVKEIEEIDIKHTVPQHRHYLTYNVGKGTPSMRQKLYTIERAQKAVGNVMEHRLKKIQASERNTLVGMDKMRAKDIKTRFGMDRLVEDLIQEAMKKGEFSDLPGMGKPLKDTVSAQNPYVDFVTHKLNQVLMENGFTPEWIQLSKEIREETQDLRKALAQARNKVGPLPLTAEERSTWRDTLEEFKTTTKLINSKIDKYNLLVPILQKQMIQIKLEDLAEEALSAAPTGVAKNSTKNAVDSTKTMNCNEEGIFDFISSMFHKKVT